MKPVQISEKEWHKKLQSLAENGCRLQTYNSKLLFVAEDSV